MGETLLSLPSLTVFKQEAPSPSNNEGLGGGGGGGGATSNGAGGNASPRGGAEGADASSPGSGVVGGVGAGGGVASQLQQLLQQHAAAVAASGGLFHQGPPASAPAAPCAPLLGGAGEGFSPHAAASAASSPSGQGASAPACAVAPCPPAGAQDTPIDCRFQYVLAAATSIATKVNEETLTYLNQGQSYEIKLKKLGELSAYRGKILKSAIRICFHERRLQYMEREQMAAWQASRPGDRIVEVDVPLSYGILDVVQDPLQLNAVEFLWDPTKEVGVYIKVNCISTEFTPKKHGGEKGVPFRIQVETYLQGEGGVKRLHAAACQIKVFKLKGADRKHKQDREKIMKRPASEQEKFQPSYECTVLSDIPSDALVLPQPVAPVVSSALNVGVAYSPPDTHGAPRPTGAPPAPAGGLLPPKEERGGSLPSAAVAAAAATPGPSATPPGALPEAAGLAPTPIASPIECSSQAGLSSEATATQTAQWLQGHRFSAHLRTFGSFSGADLLRLTRDDLIQICGLADGIRLYNALHSKSIAPRLTLYLCMEQSSVYRAVYLDNLSCAEISSKLAQLVGVPAGQLRDVLLQGPAGIHVLLTDEVIRNVRDEAMFYLEVLQDPASDQYRLLLKPAQR